MARDLIRETERMNARTAGAESGRQVAVRRLPASVSDTGLDDLANFSADFSTGKSRLPKEFLDVRCLLTRFEPGTQLHRAMNDAFAKVFGDRLPAHPIKHNPAHTPWRGRYARINAVCTGDSPTPAALPASFDPSGSPGRGGPACRGAG